MFTLGIVLGVAISSIQAQDRPLDEGQRLFGSYCTACHQYDDQGMGEAPPLDNTPWVLGPAERLVRIVLHGVKGRMVIAGKVYDREMPGFGRVLSDLEVAALTTYVRARFGSSSVPVNESHVRRVRKEHAGRTSYWTADELLELR